LIRCNIDINILLKEFLISLKLIEFLIEFLSKFNNIRILLRFHWSKAKFKFLRFIDNTKYTNFAIIEVSKINCPLSLSKPGNAMHHPRYTEYQRLNALVGHSFIIPFRPGYSGHSGFYSPGCADFFKIVRDAIHWRLFPEENRVMSNLHLSFSLPLFLFFLSYSRAYKFEGYDGAQNWRAPQIFLHAVAQLKEALSERGFVRHAFDYARKGECHYSPNVQNSIARSEALKSREKYSSFFSLFGPFLTPFFLSLSLFPSNLVLIID